MSTELIDIADADGDVISDFMEDSREAFEEIESVLIGLERGGFDVESANAIMRRLHSLCCVLRLGSHVKVAEFGETMIAVLDRICAGKLSFDPLITDVLLFSAEHLRRYTEAVLANQPMNEARLENNRDALSLLLRAEPGDVADIAQDALEEFSEEKKLYVPDAVVPYGKAVSPPQDGAADVRGVAKQADLAFFRDLMDRIEYCNPDWLGRGQKILKLAAEMNRTAGMPVDAVQLEAAAFMHDFGMVFLPGEPLRSSTAFAGEQKTALHEHPLIGAELLYRIGGWDEAVRIVMQHHEREDGKGYPEGISAEAICDGAKILAIADTIYAMTHKQSYRSFGRPLLRAVAEINSCAGTQFSKPWVEVFNRVIRESGGALLFAD